MNDPNTELLKEGLKSFLDVKKAIKLFETLVGEIAKEVMLRHLDKLKLVIGQQNLSQGDINIISNFDPQPSRVGVGALISAPETWGIKLGIKWSPSKTRGSIGSLACLSIQVSSATKRNNLFRTLLGFAQSQTIKIEDIREWPHEVHFSKILEGEVMSDQLEEVLDEVISIFLEATNKAGGLKATIIGNPST